MLSSSYINYLEGFAHTISIQWLFFFCLHPILVFYQTICNGFWRFGIFAFDIVCVSDFIIQFNRQIFRKKCKILSITECVFRRKSNQTANNAQCTHFQWNSLFDIGIGSKFNIRTIQPDSSATSMLKHCTYIVFINEVMLGQPRCHCQPAYSIYILSLII